MTNAPKYEPVLTPEAKRWLDGEMSSKDYFKAVRMRATERLGVTYVECPRCYGTGFIRVEEMP